MASESKGAVKMSAVRHENVIIMIGGTAIGSLEVVAAETPKLKIVLGGDMDTKRYSQALRDAVKEASKAVYDKCGARDAMNEETAAFQIAGGILIEMKAAGLVKDACRKQRTVRLSANDMHDFLMMVWTSLPQTVMVPRCIQLTRAEIVSVIVEMAYGEDGLPAGTGWDRE